MRHGPDPPRVGKRGTLCLGDRDHRGFGKHPVQRLQAGDHFRLGHTGPLVTVVQLDCLPEPVAAVEANAGDAERSDLPTVGFVCSTGSGLSSTQEPTRLSSQHRDCEKQCR